MTGNGTEKNQSKKEKTISPIKKDLAGALISTPIGLSKGYVGSFVQPYIIPNIVKRISEKGIKNFSDFMNNSGIFIGYSAGLFSMGYLLTEYGDKPWAWIPIVTNLLSGIGQYAYKKGKKNGARQNTENKSGIEAKV